MLNNSVPDEELWKAIVLDDSRAFLQLYNRHWRKLYRTANYYLHDDAASKQVLQDIFVVLWERRQFLMIKDFDHYLFMTARYQVFKHLKAQKKSIMDCLEDHENNSPAVANTALDKLDYEDAGKQLDASLSTLPKRCREIFRMSRIEQLSNDEIAQQLGISKRTVENQITHATRHLQQVYHTLSATAIILLIFDIF